MSYFKTIAIGNLGADCRVSSVNGKEVINFSIAISEKYKDAQGVQKERTLWVSASYWPERTTIAQYLKKGTLVLIEGKADVGIYNDKSGRPQAEFKLRVSQIQLLGSKQEGNASHAPVNSGNQYSNANNVTEPLPDSEMPF